MPRDQEIGLPCLQVPEHFSWDAYCRHVTDGTCLTDAVLSQTSQATAPGQEQPPPGERSLPNRSISHWIRPGAQVEEILKNILSRDKTMKTSAKLASLSKPYKMYKWQANRLQDPYKISNYKHNKVNQGGKEKLNLTN